MKICLTIEKDKDLWQSILIRLHMLGFKWHRTGQRLDDFRFLDGILFRVGAKGLGVNFKDKTVAWTYEPSKHYNYFIEVKK